MTTENTHNENDPDHQVRGQWGSLHLGEEASTELGTEWYTSPAALPSSLRQEQTSHRSRVPGLQWTRFHSKVSPVIEWNRKFVPFWPVCIFTCGLLSKIVFATIHGHHSVKFVKMSSLLFWNKSLLTFHRSELYESQIWTDCQIKDSPVWAKLTTQGKVKRKCEKYLIWPTHI